MSVATKETSAANFDWKRWPETEAFVAARISSALAGNAFASGLAARMMTETSTRFADWVDHLVIGEVPGLAKTLRGLGYSRQATDYAMGAPAFAHKGGMFPRIAVTQGAEVREVAIKVESVAAFSRAHDLGLTIQGPPMGPYRVGRIGWRVGPPWPWSSVEVSSASTRSRATWRGSAG